MTLMMSDHLADPPTWSLFNVFMLLFSLTHHCLFWWLMLWNWFLTLLTNCFLRSQLTLSEQMINGSRTSNTWNERVQCEKWKRNFWEQVSDLLKICQQFSGNKIVQRRLLMRNRWSLIFLFSFKGNRHTRFTEQKHVQSVFNETQPHDYRRIKSSQWIELFLSLNSNSKMTKQKRWIEIELFSGIKPNEVEQENER